MDQQNPSLAVWPWVYRPGKGLFIPIQLKIFNGGFRRNTRGGKSSLFLIELTDNIRKAANQIEEFRSGEVGDDLNLILSAAQFSFQINFAAGNAGHHRAHGQAERFGDVFISHPFVIKHFNGLFKTLIQFIQDLAYLKLSFVFNKLIFKVDGTAESVANDIEIDIGSFFLLLQFFKKKVAEYGKQPVFGFFQIVELGKVFDGIKKSLLSQVLRIVRLFGQPKGAPVDQIEMRQQMFLNPQRVRILGNFLFYLPGYIHCGEAVVANVKCGIRTKNIFLGIAFMFFFSMKGNNNLKACIYKRISAIGVRSLNRFPCNTPLDKIRQTETN